MTKIMAQSNAIGYNAYGPLTGQSAPFKRKSSNDPDSWSCYYDDNNIASKTERYIIQK